MKLVVVTWLMIPDEEGCIMAVVLLLNPNGTATLTPRQRIFYKYKVVTPTVYNNQMKINQ